MGAGVRFRTLRRHPWETVSSMLRWDTLVLDRQRYAEQRPAARRRVIPLRAIRRVQLGDRLALEFENAETLQYQVQEMLHAEGVSQPGLARQEVDAYSRLLPTDHELCATLFVELEDQAAVRAELARLTGLQHRLGLHIGDQTVGGVEIPSPDEDGPADQTVSVHFLRFSLDDEQRRRFLDRSVTVILAVEHPGYRATAAVDGASRESLAGDLSGAANPVD